MKHSLITLVAVGLAVAACDNRDSTTPNTTTPATPPVSSAAPPVTSAMPPSTTPAASGAATAAAKDPALFVDKAGRSGAFEIEASKLALSKATSGEVKTFAGRMVDDHTRVANELRQAAGGLSVPAEPDAAQRAKIDALSNANGADFDRSYANEVGVAAHEEAVALFDDYARNGTDANLKAFAEKTLPALRDHLAMAKQLAGSVVASK
jgi:putative membrane protein